VDLAHLAKMVAAVLCAGSALVGLIAGFVAYGQRRDRSFWGGRDVLSGWWWLLFPYGDNGVPESARTIVLVVRLAAVAFWVTFAVACYLW
jgi:hypothetical protein